MHAPPIAPRWREMAGSYRIWETYKLVPDNEQPRWIVTKTEGLSAPVAFAFQAMAVEQGQEVEKLKRQYPDENVKRVLNSAFLHFLVSPDRYSTAQMMDELYKSFYFKPIGRLATWLKISADYVVATTTAIGAFHLDMVRQVGGSPQDYSVLNALSKSDLVRWIDRITTTYLWLGALFVFLVASLVLRRKRFFCFGVAVVLTAVSYNLILTSVTVVLGRYLLLPGLLLVALTGFCLCNLIGPLTPASWSGIVVFRRKALR